MLRSHGTPLYRSMRILALLTGLVGLAGCATEQLYSSTRYEDVSLATGDLEAHGIAFVSPSTITGREEDKQALALIFAQVLQEKRPDVRVISLSETLGMVNAVGLADAYIEMYTHYQTTGLFKREILARLGEITRARYVAQLKLASFEQASSGRFGVLGLDIVNTKIGRIRVFFQIWDTRDGSIAWEGVEELTMSSETIREKLVNFRTVVEESAGRLINHLPPPPRPASGNDGNTGGAPAAAS